MTFSEAVQSQRQALLRGLLWPVLLAASFVAAYFPTVSRLIDGPWQTEQEGHGPLIIAASLWLVWQSREQLKAVELAPAPILGWTVLVFGLLLMFLARTQDVLPVEAFSIIPVIVGCVLLAAGWPMLRILAFPIGFLIFAVPVPDWIIDAATVPLKVFISNSVTKILYAAGYSDRPEWGDDHDRLLPVAGKGRLLRNELDLRAVGDRGILRLCVSLG